MILHVYNNPTGDRTADDGVNIWVTEVPPDYTDADVQWNIERWATELDDKVAQLALDLMKQHKRDWYCFNQRRDPTVRVYLDE